MVIEEINSYRDQPADLIYDEFEELVFKGHPLAHNILGGKKNVKSFSPDFLRSFLKMNYTPDRMVLAVVGNIDFTKLVRLAEKYFGDYSSSAHTLGGAGTRSRGEVPFELFSRTISRRTHQVHLLLGCRAPHLFDERKVAFSLLNNIIGGPAMNSRLNVAVREKYGFCYTIESQYVPFSDTGIFYIYAGVEPGAADRAHELIMRELNRLSIIALTTLQLHAAQRQYIGQMAITNDMGLNEMQSIGKAFLNYDRVDTIEEMSTDILSLTASDIQSVANTLLCPDNFSMLCYR